MGCQRRREIGSRDLSRAAASRTCAIYIGVAASRPTRVKPIDFPYVFHSAAGVDLPKWCSASAALEANFTNKPRSNKRRKGWFSSFLFAFAPNPRIHRRSPSPRPTQPGQSFPKLSCPRRIVSYPCFIYATEPFGTPCLSTHIHSMTHRNIPTPTPKPPFSLCLT